MSEIIIDMLFLFVKKKKIIKLLSVIDLFQF